MKNLFLLTWFISSFYSHSQNVTYQTNPNLNFSDFLKGVNAATIVLSQEDQEVIDQLQHKHPHLYYILERYLYDIGFEKVYLTSEDKYYASQLPTLCKTTLVDAFWDFTQGNYITNVGLRFVTCKDDYFDIDSPKRIPFEDEEELLEKYKDILYSLLAKKPTYSDKYAFKLTSEPSNWDEISIKNYLDNFQISGLEGIYESVMNAADKVIKAKYKIGIIKNDSNGYDIIYLGGANNYEDWNEGEKKGEVNLTATPNLYTVNWKRSNKSVNNDVYCSLVENNFLKITFQTQGPAEETNESFFLKLYPIATGLNISGKKGTATAIAFTQDGYLVTSQHVVEGALALKVVMNNNKGQSSYDASVILEDKNNDLAILKINDSKFQKLNPIPFAIKSSPADVGEDVYVLGYPLSTTMGNELKATDGIISSKTGFQGDLTTYQISAPVQPGNSGGPLFDKKGNLIGIISAKHLGAENVSYAVKSSYIINVLNALESPSRLPTKNLLSGKSLPDQIKLLKDYVFMIEVY